MSDRPPADPQPQCIRCHCFMAFDGSPCARCGWPEIYDESGKVTVPWPTKLEAQS